MITQAQAIELFDYNPETGSLRLRRVTRGDGIGYIDDLGYRRFWISANCRPRAHQIAWLIVYGEWCMVDHKDMNKNNLRMSNLRRADKSQNAANSKLSVRSKIGLKGVSYCRQTGKYRASIQVYGKSINLGRYITKDSAYAAYQTAAIKYFGEFARV